jgi:hypothetical protein
MDGSNTYRTLSSERTAIQIGINQQSLLSVRGAWRKDKSATHALCNSETAAKDFVTWDTTLWSQVTTNILQVSLYTRIVEGFKHFPDDRSARTGYDPILILSGPI